MNAVSFFRLFTRLFLGKRRTGFTVMADALPRERWILAGIVLFVVLGGLFPNAMVIEHYSTGCGVRIVPLPQRRSAAEQYLSHPQQILSGCFGLSARLGFGMGICQLYCKSLLSPVSSRRGAMSWVSSTVPRYLPAWSRTAK